MCSAPLCHCLRGVDGKQSSLFPLGISQQLGCGRPGRRGAVDGGGIYNLCLVPARLDTHSRFPLYNEIKQLRDISLLLADEILASADLLRPAWGCSLFLRSKTWRVAAAAVYSAPKLGICSFFPPHSPPFSELMGEG